MRILLSSLLMLSLTANTTAWKLYREKPRAIQAVQFLGTSSSVKAVDEALANVDVRWDQDPLQGGQVDLHIKSFRFAKGDWICCRNVKDGDKIVSSLWRESDAEFCERYEEVKP